MGTPDDANSAIDERDSIPNAGGKTIPATGGIQQDMDAYRQLLSWYRHLHSQFVDLIGDYAGHETFIIEGDSLLLHVFSDPHLDLSSGLQLLHAVYLVEKLLHDLKRRKCSFDVVFFQCHQTLCAPNAAPKSLLPKYLLAREVVIRHLQRHARDYPLTIRRFASFQHPDFRDFLHSTGAYIIMCHDGSTDQDLSELALEDPEIQKQVNVETGSLSDQDSSGDETESSEEDDFDTEALETLSGEPTDDSTGHHPDMSSVSEASLRLRQMILWFISREYNIALFNGMEFHDTKVMAMVLESLSRRVPNFDAFDSAQVSQTPHEITSEAPWTQGISQIDGMHSSQREILTLFVLGKIHSGGSLLDGSYELYAKALLLHCVCLGSTPLCNRAVAVPEYNVNDNQLLLLTAEVAHSLLLSKPWKPIALDRQITCDLADFVDGRYLLAIISMLRQKGAVKLSPEVSATLRSLLVSLKKLCGVNLDIASFSLASKKPSSQTSNTNTGVKTILSHTTCGVLPFSNRVFDAHLAPIHVEIDPAEGDLSTTAATVFEELSHWHNHKRLLDPRKPEAAPTKKLLRMQQRQMSEMRDYALNLTNASGGVLQPETIITRSSKQSRTPLLKEHVSRETPFEKPRVNGAPTSTKGKIAQIRGKAAAVEAANTLTQQRQSKAIDAVFESWKKLCDSMQTSLDDPATIYQEANTYLLKLSEDKRIVIEAEVLCYMLHVLVSIWKEENKDRPFHIAALIWSTINRIGKLKTGISKDITKSVNKVVTTLGLPPIELEVQSERKLSFTFATFPKHRDLAIGLSHLEFQLVHAGPYLSRDMGSAPDPRVSGFDPDKWQRDVLDLIDKKKSLLVVAPTSAGKTFISFYAMKQILQEDDDGVLIYVAPTKALVNQIAAEVQARFSKSFRHGGKSVWAVHTRDYRINNPTGCQVLITVPHILQILLLSPSHATSWSKRVKRIIFDEVHCIGQAEDGIIWEQLLLMAPCPIIALSATVGNPQAFSDWLQSTQNALGVELATIEHRHRYSDLRKFVYNPPKTFAFHGLPPTKPPLKLGLDDTPGFSFIHPYASLTNPARGMPSDLSLEPRDCWILWESMRRHQTKSYPISDSLEPARTLPPIVRKSDVTEWESKLKAVLVSWMGDPRSPFRHVIADLKQSVNSTTRPALQDTSPDKTPLKAQRVLNEALETTLPLVCALHAQNALPAIFFNYDRYQCEMIAKSLLKKLMEAEEHYKSSSAWATKLTKWESWKKAESMKTKKVPSRLPKREREGDSTYGKNDMLRDAAEAEWSPWATFDPNGPIDGFHLANKISTSISEVDGYQRALEYRGVAPWLIEALRRGIGVHHAGLNRKYRHVCEMLFRKGYLRVVIATGTLALGINMPCKTVVFSGDSIYLTALNFRQAAGRAGRRGFDLLGNIVFQHIPYSRVCRLLTSRLPDLSGHFPITTSLVLRMSTLLHGSKHNPYAVNAINSILSVPRIYLDGPESKATVLHHLRFSLEYLRRNHLLASDGAPLNFAGLVSHLYYSENSAFAFHALLKEGFFHRLCANINSEPQSTLRAMMLVMSHLFGRRKLPQTAIERYGLTRKRSSSVIILPPLPKEAANILLQHNNYTLGIFVSYVRTFIAQHVHEPDDRLPLTNTKFGGGDDTEHIVSVAKSLQPTQITSHFVALSGHSDEWGSIEDLCRTVRSGVWLEEAVVPHMRQNQGDILNAYLYDFYKHGDVKTLQTANRIRKGDVWYFLNDFSLVLATIVASLTNMLKLSPYGDIDEIEIQGSGDAHEQDIDQAEDALPVQPTVMLPSQTNQNSKVITNTIKKTDNVADNWDDEDEDEENTPSDDGNNRESISQASTMKRRGKNVNEANNTKNVGSVTTVRNKESESLVNVLKAFQLLQQEFNDKFRAMWA